MAKHIDVIYTKGVFRPAEPLALELEEGQRLTFILPEHGAELDQFVEDEELRALCDEQAGEQVPGLEEVCTSALVKYYHPEDGTRPLTRLLEEPATRHYISRL